MNMNEIGTLKRHVEYLERCMTRLQDRNVELQHIADNMRQERDLAITHDSPWMNESSAAAYLGYKTRGLGNLRRQGTGPKYCMPDGLIRFHRDDLDAYMRSGEKVLGK